MKGQECGVNARSIQNVILGVTYQNKSEWRIDTTDFSEDK